MTFEIYYFDAKTQVGSHSFTGKLEVAEIVAASGIILHKAVRGTITDPESGKVLKEVAHP